MGLFLRCYEYVRSGLANAFSRSEEEEDDTQNQPTVPPYSSSSPKEQERARDADDIAERSTLSPTFLFKKLEAIKTITLKVCFPTITAESGFFLEMLNLFSRALGDEGGYLGKGEEEGERGEGGRAQIA